MKDNGNDGWIDSPDINRMITELHSPEGPSGPFRRVKAPGEVKREVDWEIFSAFRIGRSVACFDVLNCAKTPAGWAYLLGDRKATQTFGEIYWVQGGAFHPYRSIPDFLGEISMRECGCSAPIRARIGTALTCSPNSPVACTLNVLYLAIARFEETLNAKSDKDHKGTRLFTFDEYLELPMHKRHWYIEDSIMAAAKALEVCGL